MAAASEKQVPLLAAEGGGELDAGWLDVTAALDGVAGELSTGQMVHAPHFSLLSAMSALEVMDPKMDAGMITGAITVESALGTPLMPRELTAGQIVHIMDQTFVGEMRWLAGHSLAQTVFTCLYLHDIKNIADYRYLAMAKAVLKCCAIVRTMVVQADFYEEEDFVPQTFGFGMCELIPEVEILADLVKVEDRLTARIKWLKMSAEERVSTSEASATAAAAARQARAEKLAAALAAEEAAGGESVLSEEDKAKVTAQAAAVEAALEAALDDGSTEGLPCAAGEDEVAMAEALRARVSYRRGYLNMLSQLSNKAAKGIDPARRAVRFSQAQLAAIVKTVAVGTAAAEASEGKSVGFDADVNRRLLGPAPPRVMEDMSLAEAVVAAESFYGDMLAMLEVANHATTMTSMVEFFARFSDTDPNVVPSSILMVTFYHSRHGTVLGKARTLNSVLLDDASDFGVPAKLDVTIHEPDALDKDTPPADETSPFWELFERTMVYAFRILCKNKARQHRKLGRILQSWSQLQEEARYLDTQATLIVEKQHADATAAAQTNGTEPPPPMHTLPAPPQVYQWYTLKWTTYFMLRHLMCGFELELYPQAEWRLIYWYVDHLVTHRLHALMLLAKAKTETETKEKAIKEKATARPQSAPVKSAGKKGKKGRNKDKKDKSKDDTAAPKPTADPGMAPEGTAHRVDQLLMDAERSLCAGAFRMISGLWLSRQLDLPMPAFVDKIMPLDEQQRLKFEHRFQPFRQLMQPKPLEYAQYVNDSTIPEGTDPVAIFKQAVECFKRCQVNVDKLRTVAKGQGGTPGEAPDLGGIAAAEALIPTCEKWKEVCVKNSIMLLGVMRNANGQLQKLATIDLTVHRNFPTASLTDKQVLEKPPVVVELAPVVEWKEKVEGAQGTTKKHTKKKGRGGEPVAD